MKRVILVTDTMSPDVNGVSTTISNYAAEIPKLGYELTVLGPGGLPHFKCPLSKGVRLAYDLQLERSMLDGLVAVHIATEGTLGLMARSFCIRSGIRFTTSYLTMYPEYLRHHLGLPEWLTRVYLRWFHEASSKVMCCTRQLAESLSWIPSQKCVCPKAVDSSSFSPSARVSRRDKVAIYVGRVSREKNLEAFCRLLMPARRVVVGDGPQLGEYRERFPDVEFVGAVDHGSLRDHYGWADLLVFPSKSDTYGLVMLEALACGTPVAAYPVNGALDLADNNTVFVDDDLNVAVATALFQADYQSCRGRVEGRTWSESASRLCSNLVFQRLQ